MYNLCGAMWRSLQCVCLLYNCMSDLERADLLIIIKVLIRASPWAASKFHDYSTSSLGYQVLLSIA